MGGRLSYESPDYEPLLDTLVLRKGKGIHKADLIRARGEPLQSVYRLVKPVGKGAFGVVYDAKDTKSGQAVVCKVISKEATRNHNAIRNEIAVLKALDHPHILRIFDHFEHGGPHDPAFYVICEVCSGGDLQQEIARSRSGLPVAQVARYVRQVLLAINYCHSLVIPVIHRDIKPANVMKIRPGTSSDVKLIDFGLATFSKESQAVDSVGGTPEFMAPEVWGGVYGQQCDCWGVGMMLYYLLVGQLPYARPVNLQEYPRMWSRFRLCFPSSQGWGSRNLRSARDLIRSLLVMKPQERWTAGSALKSEFIKKHGRSTPIGGITGAAVGEVLRGYQNFSAGPKLTDGLRSLSRVPRVMRVVLLLSASKMEVAELAKVRQIFDSIDRDHDGFISSADMEDFLNGWMCRMGRLAHSLRTLSMPARPSSDVHALLQLADLDEDGSIGYTEFLVAWMYANQGAGEECLRQAFKTIRGRDGRVSRAEVRSALCAKQMQDLGCGKQLAEDIAAIFPPNERLSFERFQECLQKHEDLGPSASLQLSSGRGQAVPRTWAPWARRGSDYDENDSDLDSEEKPSRETILGPLCACIHGCVMEPVLLDEAEQEVPVPEREQRARTA